MRYQTAPRPEGFNPTGYDRPVDERYEVLGDAARLANEFIDSLASRPVGAGAGLQDVAHDRVVDLRSRDARSLDRRPDRVRSQLDRRHSGESPPELAGGRSGTCDDHRTGGRAHGSSLRRSIG